ncbi:MAG TPA: hypothetical protein VK395_27925 [Gemmataceae bacterium]|nr:hypothetical protein [Gemmataceae bacterium]
MRTTLSFLFIGLCALLALTRLGLAETNPSNRQEDRKGKAVSLGGLESRVPADWVEEDVTKQFRLKQYRLEPINDDKENAELIIFHFGAGVGGSAEDNIKRWKRMFVPPQGKTIDEVTKVEKMKVSGVNATYVDLQGNFLYKPSPAAPDSETARRPDYRMLSVMFEAKNGPYFIRLVGPAHIVEHYKKGFDGWIKGFKS